MDRGKPCGIPTRFPSLYSFHLQSIIVTISSSTFAMYQSTHFPGNASRLRRRMSLGPSGNSAQCILALLLFFLPLRRFRSSIRQFRGVSGIRSVVFIRARGARAACCGGGGGRSSRFLLIPLYNTDDNVSAGKTQTRDLLQNSHGPKSGKIVRLFFLENNLIHTSKYLVLTAYTYVVVGSLH